MPDNLFFDCHLHAFALNQIPMIEQLHGNIDDVETALQLLHIPAVPTFISDGNRETDDIFMNLQGCYLRAHHGAGLSHVFVPLMIDFGPAYEGDDMLFELQLETLLRLKKAFPDQLLPFFGYNPDRAALRRDVVVRDLFVDGAFQDVVLAQGSTPRDVVESHVGVGKPFHGVKLYPSFGCYPYDPRLDWLHAHCEAHGLPVTAHCGDDGGLAPTLVALLNLDLHQVDLIQGGWENAIHPDHWAEVLDRHPRLHLNLAHFGGNTQMNAYFRARHAGDPQALRRTYVLKILELINSGRYPNLYTDVSACLYSDPAYADMLKTLLRENPALKSKVLYGSDYYMTSMEVDRIALQNQLKALFRLSSSDAGVFSIDLTQRMTRRNPKRFLGLL